MKDLKHLPPYDPLQAVANKWMNRLFNSVAIPTIVIGTIQVIDHALRFPQ